MGEPGGGGCEVEVVSAVYTPSNVICEEIQMRTSGVLKTCRPFADPWKQLPVHMGMSYSQQKSKTPTGLVNAIYEYI